MQTNAYEQVLRGHQSVQPLRNDALRGLGDTTHYGWPAGILSIGLIVYAYSADIGLKSILDNKLLMTGGAFVTGWLLGGGALNY